MPRPAVLAAESRRPFTTSHPWLEFRLDLSPLDPQFWTLMGEARSKCRRLARTPTKPRVTQRLRAVNRAKGVHATTAIEGNTRSEEQAAQRIDGKLPLPPSLEYLGQEIDNIA